MAENIDETMVEEVIDFKKIEKKWQELWEKEKAFEVVEDSKKKKYYVLEMFPYPSGDGLHMGHAFNYTIGDVYARFKRMKGFNVLYPMGYDSLGLPAENAAIKEGEHPADYTDKSTKNFIKQQKELGLSYDWTRTLNTHDPSYYKWDQWIFLKMLEKGLAYRKKAPVNWCPKCESVLANEQVHNGKCWRHEDTDVEVKQLEQWFLKITDYADELYEEIDKLEDWLEDVKAMQRNWIGKSHGIDINFKINGKDWSVFTTRPDTIYGVTFMVVSAQHPNLMDLIKDDRKVDVEKFLDKVKSTSEKDIVDLEKEGVFTGSYAINPVTGKNIPVFAGNFVVADYGSGMVMAVPAHDQRDFEFAKKYDLDIIEVIQGKSDFSKSAYTGEGVLVNSDVFDGTNSKEAVDKISNYLENQGFGKRTIQFKLKDWLISRQRYWGTPIPVVYCDSCGVVPVSEEDLPVELPKDVKFGEGNPLETNSEFVNAKCSKCGGDSKRETDTMDTFVNSSWYFLRYCDVANSDEIFDKGKVKYWMPIDIYIGGKEHACMHLIYFRFYTKFLRDLGLLEFDEPTVRLFNQGMLHGVDGEKMSKSKGNGVLPEEVSEKYGIDSARLFLVSMASPDKDITWSDKGIEGSLKFVKRIMDFDKQFGKSSKRLESKLNKSIVDITEDIENLKYNLAVIKLRQLFDVFVEEESSKEDFGSFIRMLSVFCPHICEEVWSKIGDGLVSLADWPVENKKKIDEDLEKSEEMVDGVVEDIVQVLKLVKEKTGEEGKKVYIYCIPPEKPSYDEEKIGKRVGKEVKVFALNDKDIYDPNGKAKKAKPGRPGVFVE